MSMGFGARRRGPNYRDSDDGSERATFRQLMPFLLEHKRILSIVVALSMAGALTTLAQPLVVSEVITVVEESQPLGMLVWILVRTCPRFCRAFWVPPLSSAKNGRRGRAIEQESPRC